MKNNPQARFLTPLILMAVIIGIDVWGYTAGSISSGIAWLIGLPVFVICAAWSRLILARYNLGKKG